MRCILLSLPLVVSACANDIASFCGEPEASEVSWTTSTGDEMSAGECRDSVAGTWAGTIPFEGGIVDVTLILYPPATSPVVVSYPNANEGSLFINVEDTCPDTTEFVMPAAISLAGGGSDNDFDVTFAVTPFSKHWQGQGQAHLTHCPDRCELDLSILAPDPGVSIMNVMLTPSSDAADADRDTEASSAEAWGTLSRMDGSEAEG